MMTHTNPTTSIINGRSLEAEVKCGSLHVILAVTVAQAKPLRVRVVTTPTPQFESSRNP
jgi:hypothetical protein